MIVRVFSNLNNSMQDTTGASIAPLRFYTAEVHYQHKEVTNRFTLSDHSAAEIIWVKKNSKEKCKGGVFRFNHNQFSDLVRRSMECFTPIKLDQDLQLQTWQNGET